MTAGIADTSVCIARESGRALDISALPDDLGVSVITIGELRTGVPAAVDVDTRDRRLATFSAAQALDPIPIDEPVADAWARLRIRLHDSGQRMPVTIHGSQQPRSRSESRSSRKMTTTPTCRACSSSRRKR